MRDYEIQVGPRRNPTIVIVQGEPVSLEGFEEFHFFVSTTPDSGRYRVTEASTGEYIGEPSATPTLAIVSAKQRLEQVGIQETKRLMTKTLAQLGTSLNKELPPRHACPDCGLEHDIPQPAEVTV